MPASVKCFDAAYPPPAPLMGAGAVLGYIGNHRDDRDVHIWTPTEWVNAAKRIHPDGSVSWLRQFPVWELNTRLDAKVSADQAVAEMLELGWSPGRALIGAMETTVAEEWWDQFEARVTELSMLPVCYGSIDFVFGNQAARYWVAHYDGDPQLPPRQPSVWAKQYLSTGAVDWSVVNSELLRHGGEGPRHL